MVRSIYHRFDHIIKPFAFLVLCIHWFNPLVWIAFLLMSTDMELSCDEKVIKEMGGEIKKAYSASLLSLASGRRIINGSPLAFGEGNVRGRIENVLNYKKPAFWIIAVAIIAIVAVSIGLLANLKSDVLTQKEAQKIVEEKYPSPMAVQAIGEQIVYNNVDCYTFEIRSPIPQDDKSEEEMQLVETVGVVKKTGAILT